MIFHSSAYHSDIFIIFFESIIPHQRGMQKGGDRDQPLLSIIRTALRQNQINYYCLTPEEFCTKINGTASFDWE